MKGWRGFLRRAATIFCGIEIFFWEAFP